MSKKSIGRDRWRQLDQAQYAGVWCPGCGLWARVNGGRHRDDCTANPKPPIEPKGVR